MKYSSPLLLSATAITCSLGSLNAQGTGATTLEAVDAAAHTSKTKSALTQTANEMLMARGIPTVFPTPQQLTLSEQVVTIKDVQYIQTKELPLEAYDITLAEDGVLTIRYYTEVGKFYAHQTLSQMLGQIEAHKGVRELNALGKQLPAFHMYDAPDIHMRGVVEGFYGQPWSHQARISQLEFYGRNKLNTYIYGPKDDPYHSANWREPYPADEGKKISELVVKARLNHVKFYWSIHPGHNIQWTEEDMGNVIKKLEMMYELGVRDFAVFFDDIGGEGTRPEMQAKLMNMILSNFVKQKPDVGELIMCPTQYNRAWSGGDYLSLLGRELDPSIHIMWTGDTVVADITQSGQDWINAQLQRPSFIWWNSPTTDYVRDHLCLGRVYGLDQAPSMRQAMSGFSSNPMDKPEASKIALYGVADYCWNIVNSNSNYSWLAGITRQFGHYAPAMIVFAQHNSDTGENYHKYRREESVNIAPAVEQVLHGAQSGHVSQEAWRKVCMEFSALNRSCTTLQNCILPAVEEIRPWVKAGAALGKAGEEILYTICPSSDGSLSSNLDFQLPYFVRATEAATQMQIIDKTENQNAHQPGIKVGSLVLTPMVKTLIERFDGLYMQKITAGQNASMAAAGQATASSTIKGLEKLDLVESKHGLGINPSLEYQILPAGGTITINLPTKPMASHAAIDLASDNLTEWASVQMIDGDGKLQDCESPRPPRDKNYHFVPKLNAAAQTEKQAHHRPEPRPCAGLVITNTSSEAKEIKLNRIQLDVELKPSYLDTNSLRDGKLSTALLITPNMVGKAIEIPCPKNAKQAIIIGKVKASVSGLTKSKKEIELIDDTVQIKIDIKKGAKSMILTPASIGSINEVIFL